MSDLEKRRDEVVSPDVAGKILGVTPSTLNQWRCKGRGPKYIKYNLHCGYLIGDLLDFRAAHTVTPSDKKRAVK